MDLLQNQTSNFRTKGKRQASKCTTTKSTYKIWVLSLRSHTGTIQTQDTTNFILASGGLIWSQVYKEGRCRPPRKSNQRSLLHEDQLDRWILLGNHTTLGLQQNPQQPQHSTINARLHPRRTHSISTYIHTKYICTITIPTTNIIWQQERDGKNHWCTNLHRHRHRHTIEDLWKMSILRKSHQQYNDACIKRPGITNNTWKQRKQLNAF